MYESNYVVGKLISNLLEYWKTGKVINLVKISQEEQILFDECQQISENLQKENMFENIDSIQPYSDDRNFLILSKSIRENIDNNKPQEALDRLHTFVVKYARMLCDRHGINYDKKKPLHSLFGEYVKHLKHNNFIESQMSEKILKSSIAILDNFNEVRNNRSLAHDNPILNYHESILIFNNISNVIKFIEAIEENNSKIDEQDKVKAEWDNIPF